MLLRWFLRAIERTLMRARRHEENHENRPEAIAGLDEAIAGLRDEQAEHTAEHAAEHKTG